MSTYGQILQVPSVSAELDRRLAVTDLQLALVHEAAPHRRAAEDYITDVFHKRYGANVRHFLPYFLTLKADSEMVGAVGLRAARHDSLFLEQYLQQPVEQKISAGFQRPVERRCIVEVGNLVSSRSGVSYLLFAVLAVVLQRCGLQWMIFTATPQVERIIRKMGFDPLVLCDARADKLPDGGAGWGTYYATQPQVMAGYLPLAHDILRRSEQLQTLVSPHAREMELMADALREMIYGN